MRPPCLRCGRPSKEDHHLTPRDENGERPDPQLTAPLCLSCHNREHNQLRVLGLQSAPGGLTTPERIEYCLRQTAVFVSGLRPSWGEWCELLAAGMTRWADDLARHTRDLDRRVPAWREAESMP